METSPPAKERRVWPMFVGIIFFAALMALRSQLSSVWVRAATAGCAFAFFFWGVRASRRAHR